MSIYIELLHGRRFVGEDDDGNRQWERLNGWGSDGPVFGPFDFVHSTYASTLMLGEEGELLLVDGLVYYDAVGFGDYSVFDEIRFQTRTELMERHRVWDPKNADISPISPTHVIVLKDDEPECPLYLDEDRDSEYPCPSWTADITFATAFTLEKAREMSKKQIDQLDEGDELHIHRLQFIAVGPQMLPSDATIHVETMT